MYDKIDTYLKVRRLEIRQAGTSLAEVQGILRTDARGPYVEVTLPSGQVILTRVSVSDASLLGAFARPSRSGGSSPRGKEALVARSAFHPAVSVSGLVRFIDQYNNTMGMGSRVKISGKTYLLTATHVVRNLDDSCRLVCLDNDRSVPMDRSWKLSASSPSTSFDIMLIEIPDYVWASLGVKALSVRPLVAASAVFVTGVSPAGEVLTSSGTANPLAHFGYASHTASTFPGFSGTPLISKNCVMGVHTGASRDRMDNLATAIDILIDSKESPVSGKKWRREEAEEEYELDDDADNRLVRKKERRYVQDMRNDSIVIGDQRIRIRSDEDRAYTVQVDALEYTGPNVSWADYDDEEEWDSDWEGFQNPSSGRSTPQETGSTGSDSRSDSMSGRRPRSRKRRGASLSRSASPESLVEVEVLPTNHVQPLSDCAPSMETSPGPQEDVEVKEPLSSTMPPSTKKEKRRRKKTAKRSSKKSALSTQEPCPHQGSGSNPPPQ